MKDMNQQLFFTVVPPQVIDVVWPEVSKMMQKAIDTTSGVFDIDSIYGALQTGDYLLWLVTEDTKPIAAITTRISVYPRGKGLSMDWIGGERMAEWLPMAHETMVRYAKDNGCTHLEGYGRKAWGRWLQKYGWEPNYIAYKMELNDG
jgi:hypothetical protein